MRVGNRRGDTETRRQREIRRVPASPILYVLLFSMLLAGCLTKQAEPAASAAAPAAIPGESPAPKKASPGTPLSWLGGISRLIPKKAKPPQALPPQLVGVVKMVNGEDRFVLIDAVSHQGTEAGALLVCIMNQKETANLRMSSLKNPPFLIADIASGSPSVGDRVFKP